MCDDVRMSDEVLTDQVAYYRRRAGEYDAGDRVRDPGTRFDVVFFSAWLSHVPASRFGQFWQLAGRLLAGNGRVLFIDGRRRLGIWPGASRHIAPLAT